MKQCLWVGVRSRVVVVFVMVVMDARVTGELCGIKLLYCGSMIWTRSINIGISMSLCVRLPITCEMSLYLLTVGPQYQYWFEGQKQNLQKSHIGLKHVWNWSIYCRLTDSVIVIQSKVLSQEKRVNIYIYIYTHTYPLWNIYTYMFCFPSSLPACTMRHGKTMYWFKPWLRVKAASTYIV